MSESFELHRRVVLQLDTLIPFISLSNLEVYNLYLNNSSNWTPQLDDYIPVGFDDYKVQISHSAFLLGYSYFESFLFDLAALCMVARPKLLPPKKQLPYSEIIEARDKGSILNAMIDKELKELFYKGMRDLIGELKNRFNFVIREDEEEAMIKASLIRNCLMHNGAKVSKELAEFADYEYSSIIRLTELEVHMMGEALRELVERLCQNAQINHGVS